MLLQRLESVNDECLLNVELNGTESVKCIKDITTRAKVTVIALHPGWCSACKKQLEHFALMQMAYRARGVELVVILFEDDESRRDKASLIRFANNERQQFRVLYHYLLDVDAKMSSKHFTDKAPITFVFEGPDIVYMEEGYNPDVNRIVEHLLTRKDKK
jgi:hypothetical protein